MRNLAKVPADPCPEFKARRHRIYQVPSRSIARRLADGTRAGCADLLPSARCLLRWTTSRPASRTCRMPVTHRRVGPHHEPAGAAVRRGTPAAQDHPQCLRREARPQAHVRRHDPCRRTLARSAVHRVRLAADRRRQNGLRPRISDFNKSLARPAQSRLFQQTPTLTLLKIVRTITPLGSREPLTTFHR